MSSDQKHNGIFVHISSNLRIIELYLLNIVLIVFSSACLWALPQSADILVKASEAQAINTRFYLMCALYFYVFIIWYTSRAVSWQKNFSGQKDVSNWMVVQMPRIMGFYIYAVFILADLNSPLFLNGVIGFWLFVSLLVLFFVLFLLLQKLFKWTAPLTEKKTAFYNFIFWLNLLLIILCAMPAYKWSLLIFLFISQAMFIFLVVNRELILRSKERHRLPAFLGAIFTKLKIHESEYLLFTVLQFVYTFGLIVYLSAVIWLRFAINAGTLTILFCGLGVIAGMINLLKTLSILFKVNLIFLLLSTLFIFGFFAEPHKVHLRKSALGATALPFKDRQNFDKYLGIWLRHHALELERDSIVPMIFVHADGGASRSGYWVASVLSRLEDETSFSNNLFCLSGASGGSVGNAAFFSLLYQRVKKADHSPKPETTETTLLSQAQDFLRTDFLSYTLARMLGPGALSNLIVPLIPDRARALEYALEQGPTKSLGINRFFATEFSRLIAKTNDSNYPLPIICINVTRMQDGSPALISNIKIDTSISKSRLDILGQIPAGKDINLSTATILGARFPYLSPAGLIVERIPDPRDSNATVNQNHYYVDGGYFDNSGAGIIQEIIQKIELLKVAPTKDLNKAVNISKKQISKLRYIIIHITNSSLRKNAFSRIHPFKNDFFAPVVTISGTYGSQTAVNNSRLEDYIYSLNKNDRAFTQTGLNTYFDINLYTKNPDENYPMNWVISQSILNKMNKRLVQQDTLNQLIHSLNSYYKQHPTIP